MGKGKREGRRRGRERKMGKEKHNIWQVTLHAMLYESIMHLKRKGKGKGRGKGKEKRKG